MTVWLLLGRSTSSSGRTGRQGRQGTERGGTGLCRGLGEWEGGPPSVGRPHEDVC